MTSRVDNPARIGYYAGMQRTHTPTTHKEAHMATSTSIPRVPGAKWLRDASYITPATRSRVADVIRSAQAQGGRVEVRPGSYVGEPSPVAVVTRDSRIFQAVYAS